jgi:ABC-2 type transport system permease protein
MNAHAFKTLVTRELWEHRSLVWAPLATAALLVVGTLLSTQVTGSVQIDFGRLDSSLLATLSTDPNVNRRLFGIWTTSLIIPQAFVGFLVICFYLLNCLYAERKDRSILFWKSLPVSDESTVLSKALTALIVVPVWVWLLSVVSGLMVFSIVAVKVSGTPLAPLGDFHAAVWLTSQWVLLQNLFLAALWYAPVVGYRLVASVFAPRSPLVWSILPPVLLVTAETIVFDSSHIARFTTHRLRGVFDHLGGPTTHDGAQLSTHEFIASIDETYRGLSAAGILGEIHLWLGLPAAAALFWGAARLRRWRDAA